MVEVSRNVVAILLVLVIAVSGFGTYTLVAQNHFDSNAQLSESGTDGEVALSIGERPKVDSTLQLTVAGGQ